MKPTQFSLAILLVVCLSLGFWNSQEVKAFESRQRPGFPLVLSGQRIQSGIPTLADLDGNGNLDIIVGGDDGIVYAVRANGSLRWSFNLSEAINNKARNTPGLRDTNIPIPIRTAPAVADLNNDGAPEIIVTAGTVPEQPTQSGVVVLDRDGRLFPGWPQLSLDFGSAGNGPRDGYTEGIVSSPAVGDINGDGRPEIVFAAFDQHVHAFQTDGSKLTGWPQFVLDTVWSSPAIADINGDGRNDVIIGVDAHDYNGDERQTFDGGDLYVFNGDGSIQWRQHQDEIFESSAAVADVNNDGRPEIFTGTGTYFGNATNRPLGRYFTAWNYDGSIRWRTALPDRVVGSPALGDINGDGRLEVVVGVYNGEVFAFNGDNGAVLWHTLARDIFNNQYLSDPHVFSPVLGDFDGDRIDDVFIALAWDVVVMKGSTGEQLTATSPGDSNKPSFYGSYTISAPAVGDIDNNGTLDVVSASGNYPDINPGNAQINTWEIPNSSPQTSWPVFRGNPAHTGLFDVPNLNPSITTLNTLIKPGDRRTFTISFEENWTLTEDDPQNVVSVNRTSGTSNDRLQLTVTPPNREGTYTASITVRAPGAQPITIPITIRAVPDLISTYAPFIRR